MRSRKGALKQLLVPTSSSSGGEEDHTGHITEEEPEPLSPSARLFHQPQFNCCIIAIMGSAKKIDVEACKAGLEATLVRHPRFSSVQAVDDKGEPCKWVRTKVFLDDHIVIADVDPLPENPEKFVEDYIAGLSTRALDLSRPLWDVHVLNLRTAEAEATAVFRIHHSLGDGISLMSLVLACSRRSADPESPPTITVKRREAPWAWSGFLSVFRLLWNTAADVVSFLATSCFLKDTETPLKGSEGVEFRPKRFVHRTLSLDDMRIVKNAMDLVSKCVGLAHVDFND
ncbi:hypothetical protein ACLOJK_009924 [Asimina triloba]